MKNQNVKLPQSDVLAQLVASGCGISEITARYGVNREAVRKALIRAGLFVPTRRQPSVDGPRMRLPESDTSPGVKIMSTRTVLTKRATNSTGGVVQFKIPLPRISLHVDYLREAGRC